MAKLWDKGGELNSSIEDFTVGNDYVLDLNILYYDLLASIAHVKMLSKIGVLTIDEKDKIIDVLNEIITIHKSGKFIISKSDEDCHTAIENFLVLKLGDLGKKIHTARSRNDQVITALRLYEKHELLVIKDKIKLLMESISKIAKINKKIVMPGYTHMQKAMPTTIYNWIIAYNCSLSDSILILDQTYKIIDKNTLGSGSGFGIPVFTVDTEYTAKELDFSEVIAIPNYVQLTRGKYESNIIHTCTQIMYDLNKLSSDLLLFYMAEFNYIGIDNNIVTGSSMMPNKKNADVLELIRANYHVVLGEEFKVKSMMANLISGYNRDMQLTKEPLINSIEICKKSIDAMALVVNAIKFNEDIIKSAMTQEMYSTEKTYELVKNGMPFRDAYKKVSEEMINKKEVLF